jgi:hypothetical protein
MNNNPTLTYENVIETFIINFPELSEGIDKERHWLQDDEYGPLIYVFFGNVMHSFLMETISKMDNPELLNRIFNFFERMATSPDERVHDLLACEALEYLGDSKEILEKARKLMGEETLKLSHKVEISWGRE